jgi:putative transposase
MITQIHLRTGASVRSICAVLGFSRSSYFHAAEPSPSQLDDQQMSAHISAIFGRHRRRYGYRRIGRELTDKGIHCAPNRIRRLMKQAGLRAIQPHSFVPRTSDGKANLPSPNRLQDQPVPSKPDQVWAGDITCLPTANGWIYLAVVIDLCSRKIIGWQLGSNMRAALVVAALKQALQNRPITAGVIFHSDRGSQYSSRACRDVLAAAGMIQSMSRRANPYDNAWTESFMGTLKRETLQDGRFDCADDAQCELFGFIDGYYNTQRKHSALGYLSPCQFESQLLFSK